MRLFLIIVAVGLLPFVSGCAALALGGAAAAGGYIVGEDRRPVNVIAEDKTIEARVSSRIEEKYPSAHVNAAAFNKMVLLTGEVPTEAAKSDVEAIAKDVP